MFIFPFLTESLLDKISSSFLFLHKSFNICLY